MSSPTSESSPHVEFDFTTGMQTQILQLMTCDLSFLCLSSDILEPSYFSTEPLRWMYKTLRGFYKDHKAKIDVEAMKNELKEGINKGEIPPEAQNAYFEIYKNLWSFEGTASYVKDRIIDFVKVQRYKHAIMKASDLLLHKDFKGIYELMVKAQNTGELNLQTGSFYFNDFEQRLLKREEHAVDTIPTRIPHLDMLLKDHGLAPKELGIVMAPPGRGKSNFLVHAGKAAIWEGKKVVHYTLEMKEEKVAERYDSAFSGIRTDLIKKSLYDLNAMRRDHTESNYQGIRFPVIPQLNRLKSYFNNSLVIKEYPTRGATVDTIKSHLESLHSVNFRPDLVIVDYGDLIKSKRNYHERWQEQGVIYEDLRGLAGEYGIPVWTATQANRAALSLDTITIENMGGDFEKAKIADVILALCQTDKEKDEGLMRIFIAKNRDGVDNKSLIIRPNIPHMQFHSVGPEDFDPDVHAKQARIIKDKLNEK